MFLGLDLGTTNVKALVTSESGEALGEGSIPVKLFYVEGGGVEQEIEEIWTAAVSAIRQATKGIKATEIRAIGVSSQGGALQILDAEGKPVGRVISWLDQRGRVFDTRLTDELGKDWFAERVGHRGAGVAVGHLMRLARESKLKLGLQLNIRVGFVGDVIVERLCGRGAQDGTSAALTLLYNPTFRDYDPDLLARLDIQAGQLPDLISARTAAGTLLPQVARETGLPAGIPVSAAIHDQYAAALGTGGVRSGTTMVGAGTAWVLLAVSERRLAPVVDNAFVCHHLLEEGEGSGARPERKLETPHVVSCSGLYGQIVSLVNGGSALTWALELMGLGRLGHGEIERLLGSVPAGCDGVSFWAFMARAGGAGVASTTKGRLAGLQLSHKPAHVARAVVEGLAFELRRHLVFLEQGGVSVERLVMGGSTAASQVTTQIIADVTELPLACFGARAGSTLGAAILARGLVAPGRSLGELSKEMVPAARMIRPGTDTGLYAERFGRYIEELK